MPVIWSENFDGVVAPNLPNLDWMRDTGTFITQGVCISLPNGLRCSASGTRGHYDFLHTALGNYVFTINCRTSTMGGQKYFGVQAMPGMYDVNELTAALYFNAAGQISARNFGAGWTLTLISYTQNVWYTCVFTVNITAGTYTVSINGSPQQGPYALPPGKFDLCLGITFYNNGSGNIFFDDISWDETPQTNNLKLDGTAWNNIADAATFLSYFYIVGWGQLYPGDTFILEGTVEISPAVAGTAIKIEHFDENDNLLATLMNTTWDGTQKQLTTINGGAITGTTPESGRPYFKLTVSGAGVETWSFYMKYTSIAVALRNTQVLNTEVR